MWTQPETRSRPQPHEIGATATPWAVYEWTGKKWELWHIAPSDRVAREVANALQRFTGRRFHLYATRQSRPPDPWEIIVQPWQGVRRTWGYAAGEWYAWHVRDALARTVGNAIRAGRRTPFKPWDFAMRGPDGRIAYSSESDMKPF